MSNLDFGRLAGQPAARRATEPRRIFNALPEKNSKYSYVRAVQAEVWEEWHARRDESDLLVKMNTGGGKTVVGLLILQSCLNEGKGPAIYLAPDKYLADQVVAEAESLGIEVTQDHTSYRFQQGRAILVIHVHKMVHGFSPLGVTGARRSVIEVGSVLFDDAHACISIIRQQFSLRVPRSSPAYGKILAVLSDELRRQSAAKAQELADEHAYATLSVPPWAWIDHQDRILPILSEHSGDTNDLKYSWPLVKDALANSDVAIGHESIEIRPHCVPIDVIIGLGRAVRRIYLTATLADDSTLVTDLDAQTSTLGSPVTPKSADDLGDRMILAPLDLFPDLPEQKLQEYLVDQATSHNVVVIVPSGRRADAWRHLTQEIHKADSLHEVVERLRTSHVGLVVLISKYDGIDLPNEACRILALDGLPEFYGPLARIESEQLSQSDALLVQQMQRIEQGMGRGVRASDDFCVVLLLGAGLTARMNKRDARTMLSPATQAQIELSDDVAEMLHGLGLPEMQQAIAQCLDREKSWVEASKGAVDGVTYDSPRPLGPIAVATRSAFDQAQLGDFQEASETLLAAASTAEDPLLKGVLKQRAAGYLHRHDPIAAQKLQKSAQRDNPAVSRPVSGMTYNRLKPAADQGRACSDFLSETYQNGNEIIVGVNAILEDLIPDPDPSAVTRFEQAMSDLGAHLGFSASRPERDTGRGPDDLWCVGPTDYWVIECKSGATTGFISKTDAGQLSQAMDWFGTEYTSCEGRALMIHPSEKLHHKASAREGMVVITFDALAGLREAIRKFAAAVATDDQYRKPTVVTSQLSSALLTSRTFLQQWTREPMTAPRR